LIRFYKEKLQQDQINIIIFSIKYVLIEHLSGRVLAGAKVLFGWVHAAIGFHKLRLVDFG
jgi:hypothetical protein